MPNMSLSRKDYGALIDACNIISYQNQDGSEDETIKALECIIGKYEVSLQKEMERKAKKANPPKSFLYVENLYKKEDFKPNDRAKS